MLSLLPRQEHVLTPREMRDPGELNEMLYVSHNAQPLGMLI